MREIQDKIIKSELVEWRNFKFLQPDGFKELTKKDYEKLKRSIAHKGFVEAFKVWENNGDLICLDGYHRCKALDELSVEMDVPPKFRADFISCKNRKEAADLVLVYSSIYAKILDESLYQFLNIEGLDWEEVKTTIDLPNIDLEQFEMGWISGFEPASEGEQGKLDELKPKYVICPECGKEFDARKHEKQG